MQTNGSYQNATTASWRWTVTTKVAVAVAVAVAVGVRSQAPGVERLEPMTARIAAKTVSMPFVMTLDAGY